MLNPLGMNACHSLDFYFFFLKENPPTYIFINCFSFFSFFHLFGFPTLCAFCGSLLFWSFCFFFFFCVGVGTWVLALRIFKNLPSEVGG